MTHGGPDWGQTAGSAVIYPLLDTGEAAARLGSIVTFDRRGDIVWFDDFEHDLRHWAPATNGAGAAADLSLLYKRHGAVSARLVAGSDGGAFAQLTSRVYLPGLTRCGLEASFSIVDTTGYVNFTLQVYTGSRLLYAGLRWAINAQIHQYLDSALVWQDLAVAQVAYTGTHAFHTMKLVIDPTAERYCRLLIDRVTYVPANLVLNGAANATPGQLNPVLTNFGIVGANRTIYLDDVVVTQNEPP
jgi:hypothetical protein